MTCIVGYKENNTVWLGCDSMGTHTDMRYRYEESVPKVFQIGNMLIGVSGSPRFAQILQYNFIPPDHDPRISDMEYLCGIFVTSIVETNIELRSLLVDKEMAYIPANFLLAYNGELYNVYDDMFISPSKNNFIACGSGQMLAIGAFHALEHTKTKGQDRIKIAVEAACKYDPACGGEVKIFKLEKKIS